MTRGALTHEGAGTAVTRACLVRIAGQVFGFAADYTRGVVVAEKITPVPGSPARLLGVAGVQGRVTPIFDIAGVVGLVATARRPPVTVLVLAAGEARLGLAVDEVLALESSAAGTPFAGPGCAADGLVLARLRWGGETMSLLDTPALIRTLSEHASRESGP